MIPSDRGEKERRESFTRLERLARLMDAAVRIPGTDLRIGLDPILGLFPGVGDGVAAIVSAHIIAQAAGLGAPRATLLRMAGNVALEVLIGAIPVVGDVFDVTWRANQRNVALLAAHVERPRQSSAVNLTLVVAGLVLALLVLVGLATLGVWAIAWLAGARLP